MRDLRRVAARFERAKVLLIGDTILDIYTYGTALGLSAETPTIVAAKREVRHSLGGAALVCRNLLELGASVDFITLMGDDAESDYVRAFRAPKLELVMIAAAGRRTTVKHRFWVDGYKLFQLDTRDDVALPQEAVERVMSEVEKRLPSADRVILSDYRHGLFAPDLVDRLKTAVRAAGKPCFVDSQVSQNASNHTLYHGGNVICLNLKEARCIDRGFAPNGDPRGFAVLRRELGTERIVVKLGEDGAVLLDGDRVVAARARKVDVVDTTGAGDAFLAAFCLGGLDEPEASLALANAWAGLSVQIHGTVPPAKADLIAMLEQ